MSRRNAEWGRCGRCRSHHVGPISAKKSRPSGDHPLSGGLHFRVRSTASWVTSQPLRAREDRSAHGRCHVVTVPAARRARVHHGGGTHGCTRAAPVTPVAPRAPVAPVASPVSVASVASPVSAASVTLPVPAAPVALGTPTARARIAGAAIAGGPHHARPSDHARGWADRREDGLRVTVDGLVGHRLVRDGRYARRSGGIVHHRGARTACIGGWR